MWVCFLEEATFSSLYINMSVKKAILNLRLGQLWQLQQSSSGVEHLARR